jgi:nicotinate-nucleotide adenylyltransferase
MPVTAQAPATPARSRRIGVFGGSFDPIHSGHLILASELHDALALDETRFVLAPTPPHKRGRRLAPDADRIAMVEAAIAGDPRFMLDLVEFDREGASYTVDTLSTLTTLHPGATLVFLMGEDSLRDLPTWHDPAGIARLADIGVALRPGVDVDLPAVEAAVPELVGRVHLVETPEIAISSTDIRTRVAAGRSIRYLVPDAVAKQIATRGLYLASDGTSRQSD